MSKLKLYRVNVRNSNGELLATRGFLSPGKASRTATEWEGIAQFENHNVEIGSRSWRPGNLRVQQGVEK